MKGDAEPSKSAAVVTRALDWAYDRATGGLPGLESAIELAESHLERSGGDHERAIRDLIAWHTVYAGTAGFIGNIGGLVTMPIAVPTNLASVLLIQLRMIASIAHLRGYEIKDERVRTMAYICLTGSSVTKEVLQGLGTRLAPRLSKRLISGVSGAAVRNISQRVGIPKLITKAGTSGVISVTNVVAKGVPLVGGLIGGAFDAATTRVIASAAKKTFEPVVAT